MSEFGIRAVVNFSSGLLSTKPVGFCAWIELDEHDVLASAWSGVGVIAKMRAATLLEAMATILRDEAQKGDGDPHDGEGGSLSDTGRKAST